MKLDVHLFADRNKEGIAIARDDAGAEVFRFRCLGRSDSTAAKSNGNAARDPLKPFGDLPLGIFDAVRTIPATPSKANLRSYGPGARFVLNPESGDALVSKKNGRYGMMIHGGPIGYPMPKTALRPTHGCLRVDDSAVSWLAAHMPASFSVTVSLAVVPALPVAA